MNTVAVDFDGVLHRHVTGWEGPGVISDGAVDGAVEFLLELISNDYTPAIYSGRSKSLRGRRAMKRWLCNQAMMTWTDAAKKAMNTKSPSEERDRATSILLGFGDAGWAPTMGDEHEEAWDAGRCLVKACSWPFFKPAAIVTLDDRAIRFTGTFPSVTAIANFRPWNR